MLTGSSNIFLLLNDNIENHVNIMYSGESCVLLELRWFLSVTVKLITIFKWKRSK